MQDFSWCNITYDVTLAPGSYLKDWFVNHTTERVDVWWLCRGGKLRARLPFEGKGTCALVSLLMPFNLFTLTDFKQLPQTVKEWGIETRNWESSFLK